MTVGEGNGNNPSPNESNQQRLRVQVTPKSKSVLAGAQAEFTCDVQSGDKSEPIIRWSRAGGLQLPEYHQTRGNQLILYNIETADAGRYQCTAQSGDGSIEFDAAYLQVTKIFII